jgi:LPS sulfotransferase NodH
MQVTIKTLVEGNQALSKLASLKLNAALKLRLSRVVRQVRAELGEEYEGARQELLERHAVYNAEKETWAFPTLDAKKAFDREWQELAGERVEIRFDRFPADEIANLDEITAADLAALEWMLRPSDEGVDATTPEMEGARPEAVN